MIENFFLIYLPILILIWIYIIYNNRINKFIVKNISVILLIILIFFVWYIINSNLDIKDYLWHIWWILAFWFWFIQFRITKEHEIISNFFSRKTKRWKFYIIFNYSRLQNFIMIITEYKKYWNINSKWNIKNYWFIKKYNWF